jgi:hypothetical protein
MNKKDIRIMKVMLLTLFTVGSLMTWGFGSAIQSKIAEINGLLGFAITCLVFFVQAFLYWRLGRQFSKIDREAKGW